MLKHTIIVVFFLLTLAYAQEIFLESTLLSCTHEGDLLNSPINPIKLAASTKGQTLDLKVYSKCRKNLMITLRISESSKDFVPDALIVIDRAKNLLTNKSSHFGLPIAVKFHQNRLLQKYPLKYLFRVNGKMYEEVISLDNSKNFTGCDNSPESTHPTCGFVPGSNPKHVAGFCCSCKEHRNHVQQRGGQRCDTPDKTPEQLTSAHCLRLSHFSYNVYEMAPPTLYQKLRFEVFKSKEELNGSISWHKLSGSKYGVEIDADNPVNASDAVKVTYRQHVEGVSQTSTIFDTSTQRLLFPFPSPFIKPENYEEPLKGPIEDQLLIVSKSLLAPRGAHCDLVGTRLGAFLSQPEPCRHERNTCLQNQPFDLWKLDQGPQGDKKSRYRLKSFGTVSSQTPLEFVDDYSTGSLYMEHSGGSPTYVDIEIPADDIIVLSPGYNAYIESVLTESGSEGAKIVTQVMNKELVEATFYLDLVHCSINISQKMTTTLQKIGPLNGRMFHQDLHPFKVFQQMYCFVVLYNEYKEPVAAREIPISPTQTCVCVHTCECACGEKGDLKCSRRLSDENLVATGLISEVKTHEQLEEDKKADFHLRSKRIFHIMLILHVFLLFLTFLGGLKAIIGLMCCRPLAMFGMGYFHDKCGLAYPANGWNIFCYNLSFFPLSPIILLWWMTKGEEKRVKRVRKPRDEIGETDVDFMNSSNGSEGSDVTLYDKEKSTSLQTFGRSRSDSKEGSVETVGQVGSHFDEERVSRIESEMIRYNDTRAGVNEASSVGDLTMGSTSEQTQTQSEHATQPQDGTPAMNKKKKKQHKVDRLRSVAGPGSGISEKSIIVRDNPHKLVNAPPGFGGPQSIISATHNSGMLTNSNNNSGSFSNFNHISASSSKSSFGTWHRRRRDQYSAYDFLPEHKQRESF